jgi:hypothetical protein
MNDADGHPNAAVQKRTRADFSERNQRARAKEKLFSFFEMRTGTAAPRITLRYLWFADVHPSNALRTVRIRAGISGSRT